MANRTFVARQGSRDLYLVEASQPSGELQRYYEGVDYASRAQVGPESLEKPTFPIEQRAAAEAWLLKGADPDN